jgi:hypothetical protein
LGGQSCRLLVFDTEQHLSVGGAPAALFKNRFVVLNMYRRVAKMKNVSKNKLLTLKVAIMAYSLLYAVKSNIK